MNTAVIIYPHQLFENHPAINTKSKIYLIEEPLLFTQFKYHKQKLILHRASMREYYDTLKAAHHDVTYIEYSTVRKTEDIAKILSNDKVQKVICCDPTDNWISKKLSKSLKESEIELEIIETPMFITTLAELDEYFTPIINKNKRLLMKNFYEWQRKRLGILLESDGSPVGGKWSYDEDNRKKLPSDIALPAHPSINNNKYALEAREYIEKNFKNNYGNDEYFIYPTNHSDAKKWLREFLKHRLNLFGPYEDAIVSHDALLFHSILSPLLNIGLLTPSYVIDETIKYSKSHEVSLASLEGFVRQIIGWREYMRAIYIYKGSEIRNKNYFSHIRNIPESFWTAKTGIDPIDDTIKQVMKYSYSHHITRLMIMGNFMNLCEFNPHQVYSWFMELYIDAYDWVMVPNVYSMALYSDGGMITSKPYISASSYVLKMSNYKKGSWSEVWDALFWNFVNKNIKTLGSEGRLGFISILHSKMSKEKLDTYFKKANEFIDN